MLGQRQIESSQGHTVSILPSFVPAVRRLGVHFAGLRRPRPRRPASVPGSPASQGWVERIPDPDGRLTLVGIRGDLTAAVRLDLASCFESIPDRSALHLDLSSARLTSSIATFELTSMIDELEDRRVAIRVVGLDPRLPTTECHTPTS
jgi:hypothetical protein